MKLLDRKLTNKISDMVTDIVATCSRILSTEAKVDGDASYDSKDDAKNRLKLVLMHDRSQLTPNQMEQMREEMIDVISRYVDIDRDALDLCLEAETNTIALVANIPISRARQEDEISSNEECPKSCINVQDDKNIQEQIDQVQKSETMNQAQGAEMSSESSEQVEESVQIETSSESSEAQNDEVAQDNEETQEASQQIQMQVETEEQPAQKQTQKNSKQK